MKELIINKLEESLGFEEYKSMVQELLDRDMTTGPNQSPAYIDYTKLAMNRIRKWEKTTRLDSNTIITFKSLRGKYTWLVLVEAWCGDVGQNLASLKLMADVGDIDFRIILRDEHLDLMDQFLTDGGRSIPKLIVIEKDTHAILGDWGPRPEYPQQRIMESKSNPEISHEDLHLEIHKWYATNKQADLQKEIVELMQDIES